MNISITVCLDEPGENHEDDGINEYDEFIIVNKDRNEEFSDDNEDEEQISENGEQASSSAVDDVEARQKEQKEEKSARM